MKFLHRIYKRVLINTLVKYFRATNVFTSETESLIQESENARVLMNKGDKEIEKMVKSILSSKRAIGIDRIIKLHRKRQQVSYFTIDFEKKHSEFLKKRNQLEIQEGVILFMFSRLLNKRFKYEVEEEITCREKELKIMCQTINQISGHTKITEV